MNDYSYLNSEHKDKPYGLISSTIKPFYERKYIIF